MGILIKRKKKQEASKPKTMTKKLGTIYYSRKLVRAQWLKIRKVVKDNNGGVIRYEPSWPEYRSLFVNGQGNYAKVVH